MGDLRNKFAKQERDARHREWLLKACPPQPLPSSQYPRCQGEGCGLTVYETNVYQCDRDGYFCLACMPWKWKREFVAHLRAVGMPYDAADHGEEPDIAAPP